MKSLKKVVKYSATFIVLLAISFSVMLFHAAYKLQNPNRLPDCSTGEAKNIRCCLDEKFPERKKIISELPYKTISAKLDIHAVSAILIDFDTGNILYEKNPDLLIPPASMTKLVEMYVVFEEIASGKFSLDDVVPLPSASWSRNLPNDASRMYLGENQIVTLRELLLGLAIASGNDASIAVANYITGDMLTFVDRMNGVVANLGLKNTHFVESSGYSEKNVTTARDFVKFCRIYLQKFPESLKEFHQVKMLQYPKKHNLPSSPVKEDVNDTITQFNTNKLIGKLEGCDGLKTGYINESGFNLALTASRNGQRFLSVTMRGPGKTTAEGNKYRVLDGTRLMEFAFSKFASYKNIINGEHSYTIGIAGGKKRSVKIMPAYREEFTVPFIYGNTTRETADSVTIKEELPACIYGGIKFGEKLGSLSYMVGDQVLCKIPLVAVEDVEKENSFIKIQWAKLVFKLSSKMNLKK